MLAPSERDVLTKSVALMNPWLLRDDDRDEIAAAIERGRRRVTALGHGDNDWPGLADEISLDGWRRRAVRWTLEQEPDRVLSFFSLGELLYLGRPPATARLQAWGVAGGAYNGCFCAVVTSSGQWRLAVGRPSSGLLAAHVPESEPPRCAGTRGVEASGRARERHPGDRHARLCRSRQTTAHR